MITFLIIKHQQVSDKWWQSVHCCTMFSLSCGWWRSLQISYDNNRDHLACFMLHACTADILDCPRHAPDDVPGMPQMMPQTCPRWCPQMSPSGRSAVLIISITEIIWSGNWLDGSGSASLRLMTEASGKVDQTSEPDQTRVRHTMGHVLFEEEASYIGKMFS